MADTKRNVQGNQNGNNTKVAYKMEEDQDQQSNEKMDR